MSTARRAASAFALLVLLGAASAQIPDLSGMPDISGMLSGLGIDLGALNDRECGTAARSTPDPLARRLLGACLHLHGVCKLADRPCAPAARRWGAAAPVGRRPPAVLTLGIPLSGAPLQPRSRPTWRSAAPFSRKTTRWADGRATTASPSSTGAALGGYPPPLGISSAAAGSGASPLATPTPHATPSQAGADACSAAAQAASAGGAPGCPDACKAWIDSLPQECFQLISSFMPSAAGQDMGAAIRAACSGQPGPQIREWAVQGRRGRTDGRAGQAPSGCRPLLAGASSRQSGRRPRTHHHHTAPPPRLRPPTSAVPPGPPTMPTLNITASNFSSTFECDAAAGFSWVALNPSLASLSGGATGEPPPGRCACARDTKSASGGGPQAGREAAGVGEGRGHPASHPPT